MEIKPKLLYKGLRGGRAQAAMFKEGAPSWDRSNAQREARNHLQPKVAPTWLQDAPEMVSNSRARWRLDGPQEVLHNAYTTNRSDLARPKPLKTLGKNATGRRKDVRGLVGREARIC